MMDMRAVCACSSASFIICVLKPLILMSICRAVMPCGSAGDFEIHVAEVIFSALDIGQDLVAAGIIRDQSHGHTGDRSFDRHTRIHQRQGRAADGTHRGGAIGGQCFGYDADGVWEGFFRRDDRFERTLCQRSMPDLAPALSTKRL